ncbi:MAG: hypothetical protein H6742_08355 [Alphaproteobacteria bacterium]|nr:hypothetical protein [Alphaproteobacteria bacterium]
MLLLLLATACADTPALVDVPVRLGGASDEIPLDGDVLLVLDRAEWTLSDLRLEGPQQTARLAPPGPAWWLGVARAHPGHEEAGAVEGELLGTWTVDLLDGAVDLGVASVYEGDLATGRITLPAAPGVVVEGTARVGGTSRPFALSLAPDIDVHGIACELSLSADAPPDGLLLSVDLAHALSFVDWSTGDADGDGLLTEADGDVGATARFGVVSTPTYTLSLEDSP